MKQGVIWTCGNMGKLQGWVILMILYTSQSLLFLYACFESLLSVIFRIDAGVSEDAACYAYSWWPTVMSLTFSSDGSRGFIYLLAQKEPNSQGSHHNFHQPWGKRSTDGCSFKLFRHKFPRLSPPNFIKFGFMRSEIRRNCVAGSSEQKLHFVPSFFPRLDLGTSTKHYYFRGEKLWQRSLRAGT